MTFGSTFGRTFSPTFQPKSQAAASAAAFVPTDIAGLGFWFDMSDANTMFTDNGSTKVSTDGDKIYRINDKSGNNYYLRQATESKRPLYKTNIKNGMSTGSTIDVTSGEWLGTTFNPYSTGYSLFAVCYYTSTAQNIIAGFGVRNGVVATNMYNYGGTQIYSANGTVSRSTWFVLSYDLTTDAVVTQYKNGTSVKTADTGNIANSANCAVFSSEFANYFIGYIAEIVCYSGVLSSGDRGTVETYLNNKWAIY